MACPSYCDFTGDFPQKDDDSIIVQWEVVLGTLSDWFRNQSLAILTGVTPVIPTQFYIKLHSTESTAEATGTEITGGNYFKTPIAFEAISEIQLRNTSTINSQLSTDDWGAVASMSLWDENDNYYAFGNLRFPINVITGKGLQWPAGNVTIGIGNITGQGFSLLYIEKILTSFLLAAPDVPGQMQISAHNAASTYLEAGTELSGNGYERIDVTFTRSTDRVYVNAAQATSPNPATATWSILSLCLFDSLGKYYGFFNTSITVLSGESLKFEPGVVQASLGNLTASGNEGPAIGFTTETGRIIDRPKYTPDPPPMVNDPEFQRIVEYQGRQNNRIEDLWPVSLERRVAALEGALPYARGVWPILDVAGLTFEGTLAEQLFDFCNLGTWSAISGDAFDHGMTVGDGPGYVSDDGLTLFLAGGQSSTFKIYTRTSLNGTWTELAEYERPGPPFLEKTEGWGFSLQYAESKEVLIVGCPYNDTNGNSSGGCVFMSGTPNDGFGEIGHYDGLNARSRLGESSALSKDENVLVLTGGGSDSFSQPSRVVTMDWNGTTYTYRNTLTLLEQGVSAAALNQDGSVLIVGHSGFDVGATGRVYVYDWGGSSWVERQTIDAVNPLPEGFYLGSNNNRWGMSVHLTSDEEYLFITANWGVTITAACPNFFVYRLNSSTNLYEYCNLTYINEPMTGGSLNIYNCAEVKVNNTQQRAYFIGRKSSYPSSQFRLHEYNFNV